jgi:hypothetical protein
MGRVDAKIVEQADLRRARVRRHFGFATQTLEEAVAACKRMVDEDLEQWADRDITAEELYRLYVGFGDDPFVVPNDGGFSAWDYAKQRSQTLAKRK